MQNRAIINKLMTCRLQWYRERMLDKLIQFKYVIVILIGLIISPLNLCYALFVQPIINIGYPENNNLKLLISLLIVQAIYLSWIVFQYDALSTERVKNYFNALPISSIKHYIVDLTILIIANNIFWIPVISALVYMPHPIMQSTVTAWLYILRILTLMISILAIQMQWLYKHYLSIAFLTMVDSLLVVGNNLSNQELSFLLTTLALLSALIFTYPMQLKFDIHRKQTIVNSKIVVRRPSLQLLKQTYTILTKEYFLESFIRCFLSASIFVFSFCAILLGDLNSHILSITLASIVTLVFSGFFHLLKESREKYSLYLHSLPISTPQWFLIDYFSIMLIQITFITLFALPLMLYHKLNLVIFFWLIVSCHILTLFLYFLRNRFGKSNTLLSIGMTIIWIMLNILLIKGIYAY